MEKVNFFIPVELLEEIKQEQRKRKAQNPHLRITVSDVIRLLLSKGLASVKGSSFSPG